MAYYNSRFSFLPNNQKNPKRFPGIDSRYTKTIWKKSIKNWITTFARKKRLPVYRERYVSAWGIFPVNQCSFRIKYFETLKLWSRLKKKKWRVVREKLSLYFPLSKFVGMIQKKTEWLSLSSDDRIVRTMNINRTVWIAFVKISHVGLGLVTQKITINNIFKQVGFVFIHM